jgi:hypothetical protein
MSKKKAKKIKAAKVAKISSNFAGSVHVSASYERKAHPPECCTNSDDRYPRESYAKKLFINEKGNLTATAQCGDQCFVCNRAELQGLIDFLAKVKADLAAAA